MSADAFDAFLEAGTVCVCDWHFEGFECRFGCQAVARVVVRLLAQLLCAMPLPLSLTCVLAALCAAAAGLDNGDALRAVGKRFRETVLEKGGEAQRESFICQTSELCLMLQPLCLNLASFLAERDCPHYLHVTAGRRSGRCRGLPAVPRARRQPGRVAAQQRPASAGHCGRRRQLTTQRCGLRCSSVVCSRATLATAWDGMRLVGSK